MMEFLRIFGLIFALVLGVSLWLFLIVMVPEWLYRFFGYGNTGNAAGWVGFLFVISFGISAIVVLAKRYA